MHSSGDRLWPGLFQEVSWPGFLCALFWRQTVAYLVSEGELVWFPMHTLLVTQAVACLVPGGELAWFLMWTLLVTQTLGCLFQRVSLSGF